MQFKGKAHKFGNDINTDYIIAAKHKSRILDFDELCKHVMEDASPGFYNKITPGDFIVAGENFGCGSSRETAPVVIKRAKIAAVIAKSFARIFYRNGINIGLPLIECDTDQIKDEEILEVNVTAGFIKTPTKTIPIKPLPDVMLKLLLEGGLMEHFKKHRTFVLD
ncbi:3-isopropylmalate dehydratase small subunit [Candidatus Formimonas warabiya]|uniref:3-isopropylmalate dehydratase small subunit n=1 Tax=Formimonas warabiya TaxID=1761012 RepID=A0A3G1KW18_FORW1|nr:3-isopropylmalate dehydratase small subunit [Candidatus Formimonas warabiya]ATW26587.1 3-isopropylmalate dehydratase [Candidatus Formimonas warabiya]